MKSNILAVHTFLILLIASAPMKTLLAESNNLVLVVHKNSQITEITKQQAVHLFFGRVKSLPHTGIIEVIDFQPYRSEFYRDLVDRDISEINAYWARLRFSGKTRPPRQVFSFQELKNQLELYNNAISYSPADLVADELRVVTFIE